MKMCVWQGGGGGTLLETKSNFHVQESLYLRAQCNFLYYELRKIHFLKGNTFYVESSETKTPSAIKEVNLRCYDLTFYNIQVGSLGEELSRSIFCVELAGLLVCSLVIPHLTHTHAHTYQRSKGVLKLSRSNINFAINKSVKYPSSTFY